GIFSYEVRSGLMGPADANRDGRITYNEIWAFVETANHRIPNERYRPSFFMRPPKGDGSLALLDMRTFRGAVLQIPGNRSGRYTLEDHAGVRLTDLHSAAGEPVTIWLPQPLSRVYLQDLRRRREYRITPKNTTKPILLAQLRSSPSSYRAKGAAHEAFTEIFAEPFGAKTYQTTMTCEPQRMSATPCPNYYCVYCHCQRCSPVHGKTSVPANKPPLGIHASTNTPDQLHGHEPWRYLFRIIANTRLMSRGFSVVDPKSPSNPPTYDSGTVPALGLRGEVFPFATTSKGPLGDLGLAMSYYRVLGLESSLDGALLPTRLDEWRIGLRYRWKILRSPWSPIATFGADVGKLLFAISRSSSSPNVGLPNVAYTMLRLKLIDVTQPVLRGWFNLALRAEFSYLFVLSAGEIENTDRSGYGDASISAIALRGGIIGRVGGALFGIEGFYHRYGFDFDNRCTENTQACRSAAGALDLFYGITLFAGYQY
ncbi:MAG: hypothetical protein KAI47_05975, partial [Deltaproteobacteria bacterium]|nr:hypothetical protein [Deltaproteobacteria bacterium]